jgi:hypothetical protein
MDRQQAHQLLDQLDPTQFTAVAQLLEVLVTPHSSLLHSLSLAPVEDEEIAPETAKALNESRASLAGGKGVSHEDILREFSLIK